MNVESSYAPDGIGEIPAYTVSELNRQAKNLLEASFCSIPVIGEISNLSTPSSGHWYFSLKDNRALVRCVMFRSTNKVHRTAPENGTRVRIRGRVSLYESRGDFQLIVDKLEIAGTGALLIAFEALKKKLSQEGLFSQERKKPLPSLPRRIALITSPTGAVVRDILTVLKRRYAGIAVLLFPVPVQGQEAAAALTKALRLSNDHYRTQGNLACDLVILARGGGSPEDLWAFNDETLARAIADCEQPVVSAVGHETDFTICDLAADLRAPTPSAAAEKVSPESTEILTGLLIYRQRIVVSVKRLITQSHARVNELHGRLKHPAKQIEDLSQRLDDIEMRLRNLISSAIEQRLASLNQLTERLQKQHPGTLLASRSAYLTRNQTQLISVMRAYLYNSQKDLKRITDVMHTASPLATLARGYSITLSAQGNIIRSNTQVSQGDRILTETASGSFTSTVAENKHRRKKHTKKQT